MVLNNSHHEADVVFFQQTGAHFMSGLFSWVAIIITCHQIALHARHYTNPDQQKYIVRILLIVPLYALDSWLSLLFFEKSYYIYFNSVRDCYEAFVIYNFQCLCYEYLGGEMAILSEIRGQVLKTSFLTCTCCFSGKILNIQFLRACKQATLQFCFIKPLMAALTLILEATNNYGDGDFRMDRGYLYITLIYNVSYTAALYGLFLFYSATRDLLSPYYPVLKFLTVKFIVFLSFWQGVVIAIMEKTGMIRSHNNIRAGTISAGYQNFILCVEMFFASVLLRFAFPYTIYRVQQHRLTGKHDLKTISKNIRRSINPKDIVEDTIHNFAPAYQQYAGVNISKDVELSIGEDGRQTVSYQVTIPISENTRQRIKDFSEEENIEERPTQNGSVQQKTNGYSSLLIDTDNDEAPLI